MITKNVGPTDRAIRFVVAVVLLPAGLWLLEGLQGSVVGLVVAAVGLFNLATSITRWCPLYLPFGIDTAQRTRNAATH